MSTRDLGKRFLFFGAANLIAASIPFLLTPFLTRTLTPEEYGYISLFEIFLQLLSPLIIFGGDGFFSSNYFKLSQLKRKKVQLNLLFFPLVTSFLVLLVLLFIYLFIGNPTGFNTTFIFLLVPAAFLQSICALIYAKLQMEGKGALYLWIRVSGPVFGGVITVFLVYFANLNSEGRILGIILSFALSAFCCFIILTKEGIFQHKISKEIVNNALFFGKGMIVHSWSGVLFFSSDRVVLGYMSGVRELGAYSVALQFGLVMAIAQTTFSQIWSPFLLKKLESNCTNKSLKHYEIMAMCILSIIGLIVAILIEPFYYFLVGEEYLFAKNVAYWVVASYVMLGFYKVFTVYFFYSLNTKSLSRITFSVAVFNVLFTILLISYLGMIGAAIATFISSVIFFIAVFYKAKNIKSQRAINYA
jgi:O-antigen/teichoic acid export membrane protein